MKDAKYEEIEVPICDVKHIQNTPFGVGGFWLKSMLNHKEIVSKISEKDRPILGYLQDIRLELHDEGYGYTLVFVFEKNSYFKETELKKCFRMSQPNVIEGCDGTEISWNAGCDVTHEKKKKGKGKNKKTVTVKIDSFFNFFESIDVSKEACCATSSCKDVCDDKKGDDASDGDEKAE